MRALTGNEVTILKSRFQAGPNAHRQQVKLTAQVAGAPVAAIRNPHFPWVVKLANGEAGMLYRADGNMSGAASMRVFFHRYLGQHILGVPVELFPYDTAAFGLVNYRGKLIAVCWNPSTLLLRYRSSADSGITWTAEATLIAGVTFAADTVGKNGGHISAVAFQLTTSKDGLTLYVFNVAPWNGGGGVSTTLRYRKTSSTDVSTGWSVGASTGFTIPSLGRNYGGASAYNQGHQRGFIVCETKTAGTWLVASEADDGAWQANHMAARGTFPTGTVPVSSPANLVRVPSSGTATYTASSEFNASFLAGNAADATAAEWASLGGGSVWWRCTWSVAQTLDRVKLFDRVNFDDHFGGGSGTLRFSDGSTVAFSGLPNGGGELAVTFPMKEGITWVQVEGTAGGNIGLQEVEAHRTTTDGTSVWTRTLNAGHGGGLSGKQGANGGIFHDRNGDALFYVMDDEGLTVDSYLSLDSGSTWAANKQLMPTGGAALRMGGGSGAAISGYDSTEYIWGHVAGGGTAIGVTHYGDGLLADWGLIYGVGAALPYVTFTPSTVDVSDRVISISEQKDRDAAAGAFSIELRNDDRALSVNDAAATLYAYSRANVKVEIWQWHGVVANIVKTFTGIIDSVAETADGMRVTIAGRDYAKKLIVQEVVTTASQDLPDGVRDMGNYVYLNKTLVEVLTDLLSKAAVASSTTLTVSPSSYVFREFRVSSGSLMDAAVRAAELAGMRFWADEDGNYIAAPHYGPAAASVWTYRAYEDAHLFDTDLSDDNLATRVRVIGKANLGAKYLTQQFIWASGGDDPRGIAYDATTGHVWIMHANRWLARLNPAANMAVVASWDLSGIITYPDSIAVGPDGHLWIADGFDATLTANVNRKFRKVDRATPTTTLVGPFTNPDQLHVRLWHDGTNLRMATYAAPAALVTVNATTGAEISRVTSPVNFPMGYDTDGQGGAFITGWESVDMYQITLAGSIVNTIQQPAKNSNEFGYDSSDGGLYAVYSEHDTIVKYAHGSTPAGVPTATLYTAIDDVLERELAGERRLTTIVDLGVSTIAEAAAVAERKLAELKQQQRRATLGVVGNPGIQLNDRITLTLPGHGVPSADWMVRSVRSDQADQTYLTVLVVEPYTGAY